MIQPSWPPPDGKLAQARAALRKAGDEKESLLATLNIRTLTDAKLRTVSEWMRHAGIVATALQETKTDSGLLMGTPDGFSLFLGPCVTATSRLGRVIRSRGCAWLVDTKWARKVDAQLTKASTHSCTITIQSRHGEIDLVSLYSAPSEAITDEEKKLASQCLAGRHQIWFTDANADPRKETAKSHNWDSLLAKAGGFTALNRIGEWAEKPTRYPGPNEDEVTPGHLDMIATSPFLTERLSASCVEVGGTLDPHFAAETDHRQVVISMLTDEEWKRRPNRANSSEWDVQELTSDPELREKFQSEVEAPLAQCAGRWKHMGSGQVKQVEIDQARDELTDIFMTAAIKVVGRKI